MTAVNSTVSIILNVNGLNSLIKRHIFTNWIKKQDPTIFYQKSHQIQKYQQVESKSKEKDVSSKQQP